MVFRKNRYSVLIVLLLVFAIFSVSANDSFFDVKKDFCYVLFENNPQYKKAMLEVDSCYAEAGIARNKEYPKLTINLSPQYISQDSFKINHLVFSNKLSLNYLIDDLFLIGFSVDDLLPCDLYSNEVNNDFFPIYNFSFDVPFLPLMNSVSKVWNENFSVCDLKMQYAKLFELRQTRQVLFDSVNLISAFLIYREKKMLQQKLCSLYLKKSRDDLILWEKGLLSWEEMSSRNKTYSTLQSTLLEITSTFNELKNSLEDFGFCENEFGFDLKVFTDFWFSEAPKLSLMFDTGLELEMILKKIALKNSAKSYVATLPSVGVSSSYSTKEKQFSATLSCSIPISFFCEIGYNNAILDNDLKCFIISEDEFERERKRIPKIRAEAEMLCRQTLRVFEDNFELERIRSEKMATLFNFGHVTELEVEIQNTNLELAKVGVLEAKNRVIMIFLKNF